MVELVHYCTYAAVYHAQYTVVYRTGAYSSYSQIFH